MVIHSTMQFGAARNRKSSRQNTVYFSFLFFFPLHQHWVEINIEMKTKWNSIKKQHPTLFDLPTKRMVEQGTFPVLQKTVKQTIPDQLKRIELNSTSCCKFLYKRAEILFHFLSSWKPHHLIRDLTISQHYLRTINRESKRETVRFKIHEFFFYK